MRPKFTPDYFWSKVAKADAGDCWLWTGRKDDDGYGLIERAQKKYRSHRMAWILTHGEISQGLCVRHSCDNRDCCNPAHLELGTHTDNMRDMIDRGRSKLLRGGGGNPEKIQGEAHYCAKLTETDVKHIRSINGMTQKGIAQLYGVSTTSIWQIVNRIHWAHVP